MESSAVLPLSQFPYFSPLKSGRKKTYPSWPCRPRSFQSTRLHCQKMYVAGEYLSILYRHTYIHILRWVFGCMHMTLYKSWILYLIAGFGEASPEAKAAKNLHNFFTYIAVRIVTAQLQVPPHALAPMFLHSLSSFYFSIFS